LDRHYKIGPITDHRAKFHAGRPTHLGDFASGKNFKKTSGVKLKSAPQAIAFGRTNNTERAYGNIRHSLYSLGLYIATHYWETEVFKPSVPRVHVSKQHQISHFQIPAFGFSFNFTKKAKKSVTVNSGGLKGRGAPPIHQMHRRTNKNVAQQCTILAQYF